MQATHRRRDVAHHHPHIVKNGFGWGWVCACGASSSLSSGTHLTWHQAVVQAMVHSTEIAA